KKQDRRNEMKARGTLLMALPNKDQLKFHSYKDTQLLMKSIEKRYGGNKESKKVQRTLLKQQYKNFSGSSSETMDQTFNMMQKLISQLEIQCKVITQEDMNLKLLRSLPSEWKTHALIWRNKEEIETISLDDLYNNLKIYEPKILGSSSTSQNPQNVAFVSSNSTTSNSSTNEADNTAHGVSAAHTQCNPTSGDNLKQIDPDDLEEMDLQWEMAMLTIRARRFIQRTGRKLDVDGQRVGFDRTKVECYNCHKYSHFERECRAPKNQENIGKENSRRTVTVETPTKNSLVAQDGIRGYDWSYQAEEEHPTNFALMAHTSSGSSSSSDSEVDSCSKSCVKAYATLKEQYDSLSSDYKRSQFNLVSYKAGLESVEARLAHYKKNEVVFEESINVLKLEVKLRDTALVENKKKLEKAEKERDELKLTLEKFQNSSKSLNNLLESQVIDKFKTGLGYNAASSTAASPAVESFVNSSEMLENQENNKSKSDKGYHAVPPPFTGNFIPFKPDLTFMDEIVKSENMDVITIVTPSNGKKVESNHESAGVKSNGDAVEPKTVRKNSFRPPVIEDWNSDDDSEVEFIPNVENKTVRPSTEKIKFVKSARETPKQNKHYPRGNQRNWNNLMSQRLGSDFKMINKACFVCGSFEHLHYVCDKKVIRPVWNNSSRVNHKNFANKMTHPHPNRRFVPQAVLTKSGKINTAGNKNSIFNKKVNTVRVKDTTARDRAVVNENKGKGVNVVKASACWGNPQQKEYKEKGVIDNDETVYKEWEGIMEMAATTASCLDAEQDSGSGPRCQDTILGGVDAQTRFETTSKQSNDPPLSRGYTLRSGEDSMKLLELMELCTKLSDLVSKKKREMLHLKLEDSDGISTLPNAEIFEQLALMGVKDQQSQLSPIIHPLVLHPPQNHQLHHHLCKQPMLLQCPHDSPIPRVHSLGSDEGSLTLNELIVLCTKLSIKVASLEEDLKQTKKVYGNAYTKLILKVIKLEKIVKTSQARRRAKIMVSDDEEDEEDSSKQGRSLIKDMDLDAGISLVPLHVADQGRFDDTHVSDQPDGGSLGWIELLLIVWLGYVLLVIVSTYCMAQEVEINIPSPVATKDKGKAVMQESEPPKKIKKRVQIQMSIDKELAQKLHEEEQARFNAEQEESLMKNKNKRGLIMNTSAESESSSGFYNAEWDDIRTG
ncbi:ribonuclease H-like domain-containing protein, partial [Tanacetum coccineum]